MPIALKQTRSIAVILFACLRLANYFIGGVLLSHLSAAVLLFIIVRAMPKLEKTSRLVVSGLFLFGILLLISAGASPSLWVTAFLKNADIATMLICVPMMSLPFFYEDYQSELRTVAQTKMQSMLGFCLLTSVCTHLLGVLISVGAIAIIYELLSPHAKLYQSEDTFLATLLRSYASSGFWSPAWASMVLINSQFQVSWLSLIPVGLAFSLVFMGLDLGFIAYKIKRHPEQYPRLQAAEGAAVDWRKIRTMLCLAFALIGSIILGNLVTPWDLLIIISIVAILFPLAAGLLQGHMPAYKKGMANFYDKSLVKVQSQCALFTAAGFLGKALDAAGIGEVLPRFLPSYLTAYPVLMIAAIMLLLILPAMVGIHPVATGTALLSAVTPAALGLDLMSFTLTILTGWLLAIFCSPLTSSSLILSGCCGRPSWSFLPLNKVFGPTALVLFSILIALVGPLLS
jgi:hypothetical protein